MGVPAKFRQGPGNFPTVFPYKVNFPTASIEYGGKKTNLKFKFSFVGLEGEEGYQLKYWRGNLGSFYFAEVKATCNEKKLYCTFRATPISPPPKKKRPQCQFRRKSTEVAFLIGPCSPTPQPTNITKNHKIILAMIPEHFEILRHF